MSVRPLARSRSVRALIAIGLVAGHLASAALAFWSLSWIVAPLASVAVVVVLLAACVAAQVIVAGRWSRGAAVGVQAGAVLVLCASYVAVAGLAITSAVGALVSQPAFATPGSDAGRGVLVAVIAATALAAMIVAIPMPGRRMAARVSAIVAIAVAAGIGVGGAVAVGVSGDACERFAFDQQRWRAALDRPDAPGRTSEAERLARAIDRCGTVDGAGRTTVRRLLGDPSRDTGTTWTWSLGMTNDALGPGDGQDLHVEFDRGGRARSVYLTYS
ncbi:MAG: hypothetical protein Q8O56_05595 [Solirubrobacteraceae bacterium]|nr:hypothetical protein [Solirubrobacteraceae bacterium]